MAALVWALWGSRVKDAATSATAAAARSRPLGAEQTGQTAAVTMTSAGTMSRVPVRWEGSDRSSTPWYSRIVAITVTASMTRCRTTRWRSAAGALDGVQQGEDAEQERQV